MPGLRPSAICSSVTPGPPARVRVAAASARPRVRSCLQHPLGPRHLRVSTVACLASAVGPYLSLFRHLVPSECVLERSLCPGSNCPHRTYAGPQCVLLAIRRNAVASARPASVMLPALPTRYRGLTGASSAGRRARQYAPGSIRRGRPWQPSVVVTPKQRRQPSSSAVLFLTSPVERRLRPLVSRRYLPRRRAPAGPSSSGRPRSRASTSRAAGGGRARPLPRHSQGARDPASSCP